jgi:hypothetical protein
MFLASNRIEFRKKRDFGEILNVSFTFIRQHFHPIFKNLLFIAGPFVLVGSVLPGLLLYPLMGNTQENAFSQIDFTNIIVNILSFIVGSVMAIGTVYEYMLLYEKHPDAKITTSQIWKALRKDFFNILFTCISLTVISVGILGLIGYLSFMMLGAISAFFITLIASVYLIVILSIYLIVRLCEKENVVASVLRCFKLIEGKWWQTFALLFICYIVQTALVSLVLIPFSFAGTTENLLSNSASTMTSNLVFIALAGIVLILATTLSFCLTLVVTGFQYFSLVEEKDAVGLLQRIKNLGTPPTLASNIEDEKEEEY